MSRILLTCSSGFFWIRIFKFKTYKMREQLKNAKIKFSITLDNLSINHYVIFGSVLVLIVLLVNLSLGRTARWDILDHLEMADRYEKFGTLYPNFNEKYLTGSSVYFPGVSFISIFLKKFIPDMLIILSMQILACCFIVAFYFIQKYISRSFYYSINSIHFFYATILYFIFLNYEWLIYAVEFKPDIAAYCIGSLGIIISGVDKEKRKSLILFILGIILSGIAILFKQQYIFFLFGLIFFTILNKNKKLIIFTITSTLISFVILFLIKSNPNAWYWTVTVLSDDGFLSLKEWLKSQELLIFTYFIGFIVFLTFFLLKEYKFPIRRFEILNIKNILKSNIWFSVMIFVFFGSLISSLKIGGNSGNTAFGLVILLPFALYYFNNLKLRQLFVLSLLILFIKVPFLLYSNFKHYLKIQEFSNNVEKLINVKGVKVLTGSDVYYSTRKIRLGNEITNYWMYSKIDNSSLSSKLNNIIKSNDFNYILVESWPENYQFLKKSGKYKILFKNDIGILAIRNVNSKIINQ